MPSTTCPIPPDGAMTAASDRYGMAHAGGSAAALALFADAVRAIVAYRPSVALAQVLTAPGMSAAHALQGMAAVLQGQAAVLPAARCQAARGARLALTADEAALARPAGRAAAWRVAGRRRHPRCAPAAAAAFAAVRQTGHRLAVHGRRRPWHAPHHVVGAAGVVGGAAGVYGFVLGCMPSR